MRVLIRHVYQCLPQLDHGLGERQNPLAEQHPVHRHVDVVAAARGMEPAGDVRPAGLGQKTVYIEEEILAGSVVARAFERVTIDGAERLPNRARVVGPHDAPFGQHREVGVVNRHQRLDEQRLRIFEVFAEHEPKVFEGEGHRASRKYAPHPCMSSAIGRNCRTLFWTWRPVRLPGAPPGAHRNPRRFWGASARSSHLR